MKLTKRITLITAIVFAVAGIILAAVSVAVVHGNFKLLSTRAPYEEKSYSTKADGINKIMLNSSNQKVNVVKSADDKIHITYYDRDNEKYTINVSDGQLLIDLKRNMKWYDYMGFDFYGSATLKIAVPDDMTCDFSINTSNDKITVDSISEKGNLSLKTSNGNIVLSNITTAGSIISTTSNGDIALSHLSTNGSITSTTSNGEITTAKIAASSAVMHSSNGKLILTDLVCRKNIDAKTSNDKVQINNISVGTTLKIRSSNGNINGNIDDSIKNYNITSRTSNGNDNLPESLTGGTKSLAVETSNGNINDRL